WSPDDVILFAPEGAGPLYRVSASGGDSIEATKVQPPKIGSHRFPSFLPFTGGRRQFLFYGHGTTPDAQGIYIGSLDSPETKHLTAADTAGGIFERSIGDLEPILGDMIHRLERDLLSKRLSSEQERERIEQTAIA